MSTPNDAPGMSIDLLARSQRPLAERLIKAQETWIVLAIIVLGLAVTLISPNFATSNNLFNVFQNACFIGLMALGMTPVIITGGIDISVGSILGLVGVSFGLMLSTNQPLPVAILLTLLFGIVCGAVNGIAISYIKLQPFVVTLATLSIGRSLAVVVTNNQPIFDLGASGQFVARLGSGYTFGVPNVCYAMIVAAIILHFLLKMTRWGRYVFAIGGNEHAARLSGISVDLIKVSVYAFSGLMAAVTSIFLVGWLGSATNAIGTGYELQVIAAAVIGGAALTGGFGSAFGAVVGAILVEVIRNALLIGGVNPFWQGTFVGCFILAAVILERIRTAKT